LEVESIGLPLGKMAKRYRILRLAWGNLLP